MRQIKCINWGAIGFAAMALGLIFSRATTAAAMFATAGRDFLLDNQRFVIRSGEMHYARIPREYWQHRLRMAHAMGLNTITTYVFWNVHEPTPGEFDFSGNADIAEYCRLAQREGLKVILRPGPYCCAEWDFGGIPSWLLKSPEIKVRTRDPRYLEPCRRYFKALGEQLASLQVTKGGPIIMVQVENEYGSFGNDAKYIGLLSDYLKEAGFEVPLYTGNLQDRLKASANVPLFSAVNFGYDPEKHFQNLRAVRSSGPLMCGEYFSGWFDSWGQPHHTSDVARVLKDVTWMLDHGASFNLYMVHGGTSFGFSPGANNPPFMPQTSSYDYDAPISEAGWDTPKYHALRQLLSKHLSAGEVLPDVPPRNPVIEIPRVEFREFAPLFSNLPKPIKEMRPKCMEFYDQPHGCILYRTRLPAGQGEQLAFRELHDYGLVFLDGRKIGTVDRARKENSLVLPLRTNETTLDVLVEAAGHVNFGSYIHDRKGITERVELATPTGKRELTGWEVFNLPLYDKNLPALKFQTQPTDLPAFHRARFELKELGDTFLDMRTWGKGMVWINGHNLGRFWSIGPQQTLYCPAPWLKQGQNELIVLELNGARNCSVAGLVEPVFDLKK